MKMEQKQIKYFKLYSREQSYKDKVKNSYDIILESLQRYNKPYIAFSGGKDSTVLLHMVLQFHKEIMVFHWDFGKYYMPRSLYKEIIKNAEDIGAIDIIVETSKKYDIKKRKAKEFYRSFFGRVLPELRSQGYDSCFLGLRTEESISRKNRLRTGYFKKEKRMTNIYPLRDWNYKDVWAYIFQFNIPYCSYYDKFSSLLDLKELRFATVFDPEFDFLGLTNVQKYKLWRKHNV